jgi:hypothetical protein
MGWIRGPGGTFSAIVTYERSCHVSRELSPRTAKGSKETCVDAAQMVFVATPAALHLVEMDESDLCRCYRTVCREVLRWYNHLLLLVLLILAVLFAHFAALGEERLCPVTVAHRAFAAVDEAVGPDTVSVSRGISYKMPASTVYTFGVLLLILGGSMIAMDARVQRLVTGVAFVSVLAPRLALSAETASATYLLADPPSILQPCACLIMAWCSKTGSSYQCLSGSAKMGIPVRCTKKSLHPLHRCRTSRASARVMPKWPKTKRETRSGS